MPKRKKNTSPSNELRNIQFFSVHKKRPMLAIVRFYNGLDDNLNAIDHLKSEHVWFSSPDCIIILI